MTSEETAGVTVARVLRPHGRHGEVAAEILTDFPHRLKSLSCAALLKSGSAPRRVAVRSCWISQSRGGQAIFHFEGSDSISDAEKLVGFYVQIPLADRMTLPLGSYYVSDLVGCEVRNGARTVGTVADVQFTGEDVAGTPILIIDSPNGEVLVPLAQDICVRIDTAASRIDVALPEGLLELNRNS